MGYITRGLFSNGNFLYLSLSLSLGCFLLSDGQAAPGDVNSINTGQNIQSGQYFNTPGSRTTFQNPNGGLWLHAGDLSRGLESNINKVPTGNGGTLYFRAPGNVIRLDGTIDVSAIRNGSAYTGNGGKVFVDSAYLSQKGNIFANGANGGLVQFNVGGFTLGSNAKIMAQGFGGEGGAINVASPGTIDIRTNALIDASGKVAGTFDTSVISIEGSAINNRGIVRANGLANADLKPDNGDAALMAANRNLANNPFPKPISAGNGTVDNATMRNILFATPGSDDFRGGTVRLVAAGQNHSTANVIATASNNLLSASEKNDINSRNGQITQLNEGDVLNQNQIQANGALSKNGGSIIVSATRRALNGGTIEANGSNAPTAFFNVNGNGANGGNGGAIIITAMNHLENAGTIRAFGGLGGNARDRSISTGNGANAILANTSIPGQGGAGGAIAFSYGNGMSNTGKIHAFGGQGGQGGMTQGFDQEQWTASHPDPVARTNVKAGVGGSGGQGGIIEFSGDLNPTGGGSALANGGQGGFGGNAIAVAHGIAQAGRPKVEAQAIVGNGGKGGGAGAVIAPRPHLLSLNQRFSARLGGAGNGGTALVRKIFTRNNIQVVQSISTSGKLGAVLVGTDRGVIATRRNEYILHAENGALLSRASGVGNASETLTGRLEDAVVRTVANPLGSTGTGQDAAQASSNFVIASSAPNLALTNNIVNANTNPLFFNLNSLTILNNGNLTNNTLWTPGVHLVGTGFHDLTLSVGGGHINWLANGNLTNNQIVMTRGLWSGGSLQMAATGNLTNTNDLINIAPNKALLSGFSVAGPLFESSHSGSTVLKAGRDLTNTASGKIATSQIFFDIHSPLNQNPAIDWPKFLNGAQIGANINLLAGLNLINNGNIGANAITYRNGQQGSVNPALTIGGIILGRSRTGNFSGSGITTATGQAFFSQNETDGPRFNNNIFPTTTSFNGFKDIN